MSEAKRFHCDSCDNNFESITRADMSCPYCGSGNIRQVLPVRKKPRTPKSKDKKL